LSAAELQEIEQFTDALWMERGLSKNTLTAYRNDLAGLAVWLAKQGRALRTARRQDLLGYLSERVTAGARPRTTARLVSSMRRFYRYLVREGHLQEDPSVRIDTPRIGRPLPDTLSETEVEALLDAPDDRDTLGLRDRAMLELLYACGLRVSELVWSGWLARATRSDWCRWARRPWTGCSVILMKAVPIWPARVRQDSFLLPAGVQA
jgi:integrase/recombinase XerD